MSVSMTLDAVRAQQKTVTRRHVDSWKHLRPGDRLTLIEKGMGLPKGAKQVVVCDVEITNVSVEPIGLVDADECAREGLPEMTPVEFIVFWLKGHKHPTHVEVEGCPPRLNLGADCRRIEWRYLPSPSPLEGTQA
jgi:hypothetical protein